MNTSESFRPILVVDLGGSIVVPNQIDRPFLSVFVPFWIDWLAKREGQKLIVVVGGGHPARLYQEAYRNLIKKRLPDEEDWIGIAATHLNAQLLKSLFGECCQDPVVSDPTGEISFKGTVLIAGGWKPGFSTDYDAVLLAKRFGASTVLNLTNIEQIYSEDPQKNPKAKALSHLSWQEYLQMSSAPWSPGMNLPFDPVASKEASSQNLRVITALGRNLANLKDLLSGKPFIGTTVGNL